MIHAIVLAAGRSRRMGERVQKLLLPFGGDTVIGRVVREVTSSPVDQTHVVVAPDTGRVREALSDMSPEFVLNPEPEGDMLSSVRCGVRALPAGCEAVLVALGDQPTITSQVIADMIEAFRDSDHRIVVPTYEGKRGHPLLFSGRYCQEVLDRYDNVGLRGLLRARSEEVLELQTVDPTILKDIDYPQDYVRALARLRAQGNRTWPT